MHTSASPPALLASAPGLRSSLPGAGRVPPLGLHIGASPAASPGPRAPARSKQMSAAPCSDT